MSSRVPLKQAACGLVLISQPRQQAIQKRRRPALLVDAVRRERVARFKPLALIGVKTVPTGHRCAAAALLGASLLPFVDQEVFERGQQEGTESSSFRIRALQIFAFEKTGKELLGQVLGIHSIKKTKSC